LGVLLLVAHKDGPRGDALERRVRAVLDEPVLTDVDEEAVLDAILRRGPRALAELPDAPDTLREIVLRLPQDEDGPSAPLPHGPGAFAQLGTVGGGNHFAEIARVDRVFDRETARTLGLSHDAQAVLVHTGSRGLGAVLAERHTARTLTGEGIEPYLAELRAAVRYARANRFLVAYRLLSAAGLGTDARIASVIDLVHNDVTACDGCYVHRKGAAPAAKDAATVVLGSRGAPSFVMRGTGSARGLACVAHGAGRRMGRSEAVAKLKAKHTRASLTRTALGGRVIADDATIMYEEHPDAYKPIEPVIASLESDGLATRVASLVPMVTVKR
jgi:release factor H-coupled RctB family protein